ncbi:MAG: SDR family oxidoreductase, partial [Planctomycetaceae bacterium]
MILVTGADGQLGRAFCRLFGSDAIGLNRSQLEITSAEQTRTALERMSPSAIVNCAAYTAVDKAEDEPDVCLAINRDGVSHLAAVARDLDALLVHISTDYVFGEADEADGPL